MESACCFRKCKEVLFLGKMCSHIYIYIYTYTFIYIYIYIKNFLCDSLISRLILLYTMNISFRRYNLYDNEGDGNVLVYGVYLGIRKNFHINTRTLPPNTTLYYSSTLHVSN